MELALFLTVAALAVGPIDHGSAASRKATATANAADLPIRPVKSLLELRRTGVVMQQYDYSCGAASLATLLNGYFGTKYTELDILKTAGKRYTEPEWKQALQRGLSLDDLSFVAQELGFEAEGAKIGMAGLLKVNGPLIVHENKGPGLEHFTVFRGTKNGVIWLADPAIGNAWYSPGDFVSQFTGYALAVWKKDATLPKNYPLAIKAKDGEHELRHARDLWQTKREFLPTVY